EVSAAELFRVFVVPAREVDRQVEVVGDAELELVAEVDALEARLALLVGLVGDPLLVFETALAHGVGVGVEGEGAGVGEGGRRWRRRRTGVCGRRQASAGLLQRSVAGRAAG